MRVEMHEIETHVARAHVAHDRVAVGSVVVHQPAGRVHGAGDLGDVILEQAQRIRIGHHADGGIRPERFLNFVDADAAALVARQRNDLEAAHRGGRRIRAVRGVGNDHFVARRLAALFEVVLSNQQRREFGVRAGRRD